eukprot:TRINITY_DN6398_c1_g1_i1.p1 TRINITY_DN6398_c1_g1~~TRINITY_DN6398_c1_g1_i1.p1  ORF type:complete len:784 (+),score=163.00 TRINITY_DN6398_c1_g1_i1:95-2446(+)
MRVSLVFAFAASFLASFANAWKEWTWEESIGSPGERMGHSMVLYENQVFLFGGRGSNTEGEHIPKTYEIEMIDGNLEFKTYDEKPVHECDPDDPLANCETMIPIGTFFNDIWRYDLDCERDEKSEGCKDKGWTVLESGEVEGGCRLEMGNLLCTHPSERYGHSSVVLNDGTMLVYGGISQLCTDYCSDIWAISLPTCLTGGECVWTRRTDMEDGGPGKRWGFSISAKDDIIVLFGGHRLWHGFALENDYENDWSDTSTYPVGGYLDDMWTYDYSTDKWKQIESVQECIKTPGETWEERNNVECNTIWPIGRMQHASFVRNGNFYLQGGYSTPFPYPNSAGRGAGPGIGTLTSEGYSPYPDYPFYLEDFWVYDFSTGLWREVEQNTNPPDPRMGHKIELSADVAMLFGGYAENIYFQDVWYFNFTNSAWLEKKWFVHPILPDTCTSDVDDEDNVVSKSVYGQPTRATVIDGKYGRSDKHVFIEQARRATVGWDGCRDHHNSTMATENGLEDEMTWERPTPRQFHATVFSEKYDQLILYGGFGLKTEMKQTTDLTRNAIMLNDMWAFDIHTCMNGCSSHGNCRYGNCICDNGFYGIDCSNMTCPGTFCYNDPFTMEQHCKHCCHATYTHADGQGYEGFERKVQCDLDHQGESHGICDGFGNCQCAPPFIGADCAIRDCPDDCSGHGYCSIQYPNSRCSCDPGYYGLNCGKKYCLNNCSYPNGDCQDDGTCVCKMTYNPYNRTQEWRIWGGEDCSYITPFASAFGRSVSSILAILVGLLTLLIIFF